MKKPIIIIVAIILLTAVGFGSWYLFIKKSSEGENCSNYKKCEQGLKCINKTCSSGKIGSACTQKSDCQSKFCVKNTCTEGKEGNICTTYKDCENGLLCTKSICSKKPNYSKYFEKVTISKMKPGMPPGPNNPMTETASFTRQDTIEVDFRGVKNTTVGPYYFTLVNSITGEMEMTTKDRMATKFEGRDTGCGTDLNNMSAGEYDLNVYFQDELVYSTAITLQSKSASFKIF